MAAADTRNRNRQAEADIDAMRAADERSVLSQMALYPPFPSPEASRDHMGREFRPLVWPGTTERVTLEELAALGRLEGEGRVRRIYEGANLVSWVLA